MFSRGILGNVGNHLLKGKWTKTFLPTTFNNFRNRNNAGFH